MVLIVPIHWSALLYFAVASPCQVASHTGKTSCETIPKPRTGCPQTDVFRYENGRDLMNFGWFGVPLFSDPPYPPICYVFLCGYFMYVYLCKYPYMWECLMRSRAYCLSLFTCWTEFQSASIELEHVRCKPYAVSALITKYAVMTINLHISRRSTWSSEGWWIHCHATCDMLMHHIMSLKLGGGRM